MEKKGFAYCTQQISVEQEQDFTKLQDSTFEQDFGPEILLQAENEGQKKLKKSCSCLGGNSAPVTYTVCVRSGLSCDLDNILYTVYNHSMSTITGTLRG
jgi:hypothetical protein